MFISGGHISCVRYYYELLYTHKAALVFQGFII